MFFKILKKRSPNVKEKQWDLKKAFLQVRRREEDIPNKRKREGKERKKGRKV